MPYSRVEDLPASVRDHLPHHALEIFRAAFNAAFAEHGEEAAFRIAWAAVKRRYQKSGDSWVQKDGRDND